MKMKLAKRIISAVLAIVLCMSFITGCANQGKTEENQRNRKQKNHLKLDFHLC